MTIDGNPVTQDATTTVSAGTHTIGEVDSKGDVVTFSGDCNGTNQVTVANGDAKTCTVTNTMLFVKITLNKVMQNPFGGNDATSTFNLFVNTSTGNIAMTTGVTKNFAPGSFVAFEGPHTGYHGAAAGDCDSSGSMSSAGSVSGSQLTCNITNTETQPVITVIKQLNQGSSGTASPSDFTLIVDGQVLFASSQNVTSNGAGHTITEDPDNATTAGYTFTSMTGTGSRGTSCPSVLGGTVILKSGETIPAPS